MKPAGQHLYLMQNEHGLIKIGRSDNPERRRRNLESEERCRIAIVVVQEAWGEFEEEIHIEMADCRLIGEWFDGDPDTRLHALIAFDQPEDTLWPFAHDVKTANAWLEQLEGWRWERAIRKEINRTLQALRERPQGCIHTDAQVWRAIACARDDDAMEMVNIPPVTTDLNAAMTLWREGKRPARWTLSAAACCASILRGELEIVQRQYSRKRR